MRAIIKWGVESRVLIYFVCLILFVGGIISFFNLGQLEDPVFTVKDAIIMTQYPGASPREVELEVTDRLETAIQEMPQVKEIYSTSRAGLSIIKVSIKEQYWSDVLPQVWDELRKKVHDVTPMLPPGTSTPDVSDDFGFVYGFVLALTGDGYDDRELEKVAKTIRKELSLVKNVARVQLWGVQPKVIYLDVSEKQLAGLKITAETLFDTLQKQNMVVNAGSLDEGENRLRIAPTGEFTSPEEIGELILRPAPTDILINSISAAQMGELGSDIAQQLNTESQNVIRVKDVATVRRGYQEPPIALMRFDGKPAIGIQIAGTDDANIVDVGEALYKRLEEISAQLPVGLEIHKVAWQSDLVDAAVKGFFINLLEALVIVLIVLIIPSGLRMGLVVGTDLILTILGTFIVMAILEIPLQRMSLGALVIALGMMVDNSIVVADGIAVKIRQGMARTEAAISTARATAWPLLAATLVATMTFYPIFASREDAGEYCRTLFIVVATSLLLSWFIAMLVTPLQSVDMLPKVTAPTEETAGEFDRPFFVHFRRLIARLIRFRWITVGALAAAFLIALGGFGLVRQMFFPDSTRPQMMIDYWAPAGVRIQEVATDTHKMEQEILSNPLVANVTTFIGAGPPRFYLPVEPELPNQNYAQLVINFNDYRDVDPFIEQFEPWIAHNIPDAMVRLRKYAVGPSDTWPFEARISGPGQGDIVTLTNIAEQVKQIASSSDKGRDWRFDTQNPTLKLVPEYDQKKGRWSAVTRHDMANALLRSYDGLPVGLYREGDDLYPIIVRNNEYERQNVVPLLNTLQIKPTLSTSTVPLSQVTTGVRTEWENPIIARWNRRRAITVQGAPKLGVTFPELYKDVAPEINNIGLPPGYEIHWDGEYDSTVRAKRSLIPGSIPAIVAILILLVAVFNAIRPVIIVLLTIPLALIGITAGLLIFNIPFGFMALLGAMSLAGMMTKNIVVLLDAARENHATGMRHYRAIIESAISRTRPVLLAAGTTFLGVIPLLTDVFWVSMATTIMAGLAFGSLLTLVAVPVLYAIFYQAKEEE